MFFYLRTAQYNAHSHPIIDQPNTQLPRRTACICGFPLPFWRAIHDGAKITPNNNNTHIAYLPTSKNISQSTDIAVHTLYDKGALFMRPPVFSLFISDRIINHILRLCPVLLRYELIDCISPYDLYVT